MQRLELKISEEEDAVPALVAAMGWPTLIRVDGHSGAGKSRLAKALAVQLGITRVATDDFLDERGGPGIPYINRVEVTRLLDALEAAVIAYHSVLLDGLCLDELVPLRKFGAEYRIYVESITDDEFHEDDARRNRELGTARYHEFYQPKERADAWVIKRAHF